MRERFSSGVGWRIARSDELNAFELDPCLVGGAIEAAMFDHLTQEGDYSLRAYNITLFFN